MPTAYINLGTGKACLFVKISTFLMRQLEQYPLLYYAVEEALECAKNGYYGIGIVAFAQLLNVLNEKTPESRHWVAHELLRRRPTKESFDSICEEFKTAAAERSDQECSKCTSGDEYQERIGKEWQAFAEQLHNLGAAVTETN